MLISSNTGHQANLLGTDLLLQLDPKDPLLKLAKVIPWSTLDNAFAKHYCQNLGRPTKPIRLMSGLLILKQLENLTDEKLILECKRIPYYQAFFGLTEFSNKQPCDSSELTHFRNRIGTEVVELLFKLSVQLHGNGALEDALNIDKIVQEMNITYPTDGKLAIKIINRLNKLAKLYRVHKIYSMHEPDVNCIGKGKDHKPYEYDNRVSIAATATSNIIECCKRIATIEPIIGHLKSNFGLSRNFLKGTADDHINLLMSAIT